MNNTEKDRVAKGCPSLSDLSAYFDGENVENKAAIKEHVESCPVCREELRFFEKVASATSVKLSAEEAEKLTRRISAGFHRKIAVNREEPRILGFPILFMARAAAMFVLCGGVGFLVIKQFNGNPGTPVKTPRGAALQVYNSADPSAVEASLGPTPGHELNSVAALPAAKLVPPSSVDVENLSPVSFGGEDAFAKAVRNIYSVKSKTPANIKDSVHQVWVTPENADSYHTIRMLVDALKLSPAAVSMRTIPGGLRLTMTLNKMQLITFVRNCKNVGMQLVSPEQPQPEQSLFNGSATDSVIYTTEFLSGGK